MAAIELTNTELLSEGHLRSVAQAHALDEVLFAALCRPNAAGRSQFSSLEAFEQRQLLKALGRYHGEHLVVGVTALEIHVVPLTRGRAYRPLVLDRAVAQVSIIDSRPGVGADAGPAMLLVDRRRALVVELRTSGPGATIDLLAALRGEQRSRDDAR